MTSDAVLFGVLAVGNFRLFFFSSTLHSHACASPLAVADSIGSRNARGTQGPEPDTAAMMMPEHREEASPENYGSIESADVAPSAINSPSKPRKSDRRAELLDDEPNESGPDFGRTTTWYLNLKTFGFCKIKLSATANWENHTIRCSLIFSGMRPSTLS